MSLAWTRTLKPTLYKIGMRLNLLVRRGTRVVDTRGGQTVEAWAKLVEAFRLHPVGKVAATE